jgi:hypothetical protein
VLFSDEKNKKTFMSLRQPINRGSDWILKPAQGIKVFSSFFEKELLSSSHRLTYFSRAETKFFFNDCHSVRDLGKASNAGLKGRLYRISQAPLPMPLSGETPEPTADLESNL